jgi:hypothetical protein
MVFEWIFAVKVHMKKEVKHKKAINVVLTIFGAACLVIMRELAENFSVFGLTWFTATLVWASTAVLDCFLLIVMIRLKILNTDEWNIKHEEEVQQDENNE